MKFFIPTVKDKAKEDQVYMRIKKLLKNELGAFTSERRIFKLAHRYKGKEYIAEVGKIHPLNREPVIAIIYEGNRKIYYICTPTRGVIRGMPILCGGDHVISFEDFEA